MENRELIKELLNYPMDSEVQIRIINEDERTPIIIESCDKKHMKLDFVGQDCHDISPKIFLTAVNQY